MTGIKFPKTENIYALIGSKPKVMVAIGIAKRNSKIGRVASKIVDTSFEKSEVSAKIILLCASILSYQWHKNTATGVLCFGFFLGNLPKDSQFLPERIT